MTNCFNLRWRRLKGLSILYGTTKMNLGPLDVWQEDLDVLVARYEEVKGQIEDIAAAKGKREAC